MAGRAQGPFGIAAGLAAVAGWAIYSIAGRQGLEYGFSAGQLAALRYAVPALCLAPLLAFGLWPRLKAIGLWRLTLLCLLAGPLYGFVVMYGLTLSPLAHAVVLGPGLLMVTALFCDWRFEGVQPRIGQVSGGALLLVGVATLAAGAPQAESGENQWLGDLLFAASGVAMGVFTALTRRWSLGPVDALAGIALLGSIVIIPFAPTLIATLPPSVGRTEILWQIIAQGLVGGLAAMLAYVAAIRRLGAGRAAFFPGFVPGVTVASAAALGVEAWTTPSAIGVGIATVGLIIAQLGSGPLHPKSKEIVHA